MVTESHLPVKKRYKSYILYYRVHNQGNRAFLQGNQKTSSYCCLGRVCRAATRTPHTLLDTPFSEKPVFLRLESGWGQSDVAQLLTSEC